MQIIGLGLNTKSELKNIKSLLKVGEIIEVSIISKKGENIYLLQIRGNIFEGLATKNINEDKIKAFVDSTEPNIILKSEKDDKLEIKLNIMLKKSTNLNEKTLSIGKKDIVIKTQNAKENQKLVFNVGDIIEAEIVSKKSPSTYILKIDKTLFEAFAKLNIDPKENKLTLLVEKTSPEIVLKAIDKKQITIEYIKGKKSIALKTDKPILSRLSEAISKIESSADIEDKKGVLINSSKALSTTSEIKAATNNIKNLVENLKKLDIKTLNLQNQSEETFKKSQNLNYKNITQKEPFNDIEKMLKTPISDFLKADEKILSKEANSLLFTNKKIALKTILENIIQNINKNNGENIKIDKISIENSIEKIENLINMEQFASLNFLKPESMNISGFFGGFLQELSESLDKILSNTIKIEENIKLIEKAAVESKFNNIKEPLDSIKNIINSQQNNNPKNLSLKIDTQTALDSIKNILQQTKTPTNISNLFIQIPIFIENKKGELYISKKEETDKKTGKRSFKIRVVSNMNNFGTVQIDGIYFEGAISCSVGFDNKEMLAKFDKSMDSLKNSLGKNVSISSYFIKSKPVVIQKKLNIKI